MIGIAFFVAAAVAQPNPLLAEMQRLEHRRNAAIKAGDMAALEAIYEPDFRGIAGNGRQVDRPALFAIFKRNAGGDFIAESTILSARREGPLVLVEGRLKLLSGDRSRTLSESLYLHVFRRRGDRWRMIGGAATPIQQPAQ